MNTPRTLIIGLDGATFDLIEPWAQAGHLPALAKLMAGGIHGPLQAWPNMNSAAAWTSMVTGYNPGEHGIYDFGDALPQRDSTWHPSTGADRRRDPFWRLLSDAGQHVGVINMPISYPADLVHGFMLAGMDAPGIHSAGFAHPPDLLDELRRQGIDYVLDVPDLGTSSHRDPHHLPHSVQEMVDVRTRTLLHLMQTHPWDILMSVFVATDRVQHFFWPEDETSPEGPRWAPVRALYQRMDAHLNELLKHIDADTTVLIVSDHGFGPKQPVRQCLNLLFAHLGLLQYREGGTRLQSKLLKALLFQGRRIIPQRFQLPLAQAFPRLRLRAIDAQKYAGIEWSRTQVFSGLPGRNIRINLRGRQPEGVVPSEDYHLVRERVRNILLDLTDPSTGRRLVRTVHKREDLYHGPYIEQADDLLIEWEAELPEDAIYYDADDKRIIIGAPEGSNTRRGLTGTHRSEGVFIAYGPHIKPGTTVVGATLYDIAPTILYLQGHPIPRDMDGKVLTGIFTEEHLHHHPICHSEPTGDRTQASAPELETEDIGKIEERLRNLGYIE